MGGRNLRIRIRSWHDSEISAWVPEGRQRWLDINKNYPLYRALKGSSAYLAETAILLLCQPQGGDTIPAREYVDNVNLMLLKWAQVAGVGAAPEEAETDTAVA